MFRVSIGRCILYNPDNYLAQVKCGDLFSLLAANYFLFFCSDLALFIFPTLLDDIKRPNWKSAQGHYPVEKLLIARALYSLIWWKNFKNISKCNIGCIVWRLGRWWIITSSSTSQFQDRPRTPVGPCDDI